MRVFRAPEIERAPTSGRPASRGAARPAQLISRVGPLGLTAGRPLASDVRAFFERRIGFDFTGIRIHTDARSDAMTRVLGARAFTVGRDLVFRRGQFEPSSIQGRRLLAHELTHAVQQSAARNGRVGAIRQDGALRLSRWAINGNLATANRPGDTLSGLARRVTGNWRDWPCIWIRTMRDEGKSWTPDYPNYIKLGDTFDLSNLTAREGSSLTLEFQDEKDPFLAAVQALYGGQPAVNVIEQLRAASGEGKTPIQSLTLGGHCGENSERIFGAGSSFTPRSFSPSSPAPSGIGANSKLGPHRCWFTRNARVRVVGCSSQTVAASFARAFLRRGASATGTNRWLCGWRARNVLGPDRLYVTMQEICSTPHAPMYFTAAALNRAPGLWVEHRGRA